MTWTAGVSGFGPLQLEKLGILGEGVSQLNEQIYESFHRVLSDVRQQVDEDIFWNWDGRLQAAVLVVKTANSRILNESLASSFENRWDIESIQGAPGHVREVVEALSGLRERQFIYTNSPTESGSMLYAAYWPWTNGDLISVRVSMLLKDRQSLSSEQQIELLNQTLSSNH